ncbi:MAG: hypothetical protein ACR2QG_03930 [Gammaproteobacteria bacterium]
MSWRFYQEGDDMGPDDKMLEALEQVSYYELSELILLTYSTLIEQLTVFLTVVFAYFVVAYLVGKKLSIFQICAVTLVYSAFCLIALGGYFALSERLWNLVFFRDGEVPLILSASFWVCVIGWLLSLVFMLHARYKSN